jgi:hypothetical protein
MHMLLLASPEFIEKTVCKLLLCPALLRLKFAAVMKATVAQSTAPEMPKFEVLGSTCLHHSTTLLD